MAKWFDLDGNQAKIPKLSKIDPELCSQVNGQLWTYYGDLETCGCYSDDGTLITFCTFGEAEEELGIESSTLRKQCDFSLEGRFFSNTSQLSSLCLTMESQKEKEKNEEKRKIIDEKLKKANEMLADHLEDDIKKIKYLFFDTETTGIPPKSKDYSMWPRIVQLSFILTDSDGKEIQSENIIIKPQERIPNENIHGISNERASREGIPIKSALDLFLQVLGNTRYIVGHNIKFDMDMILSELHRIGNYDDVFKNKFDYCTMRSGVSICNLKGCFGKKWPKLTELYRKLFNKDFKPHDGLRDVQATMECFFKMKRMGVFQLEREILDYLFLYPRDVGIKRGVFQKGYKSFDDNSESDEGSIDCDEGSIGSDEGSIDSEFYDDSDPNHIPGFFSPRS